MKNKQKVWVTLLAGMMCGAVVWALAVPLAGVREPFDSNTEYYHVAMFISGLSAALVSPRHWWLAVLGIYIGERLYAFIMLPETRAWFLFGFFINLLIPTWLPAAFGAFCTYLINRWKISRGR